MFLSKLKLAGMALLVAALAATGASVSARQGEGLSPGPLQAYQTAPRVPDDSDPSIVARVDGVPITRDELIERCLERHGAEELESMINQRIIQNSSERQGIQVTSEELEAEAASTAGKVSLTKDDWFKTLKKQKGLSKDEYLRDVLYPSLLLKKLGGGAEPGEVFEKLKKTADIQVYFTPPGDSNGPPTGTPLA